MNPVRLTIPLCLLVACLVACLGALPAEAAKKKNDKKEEQVAKEQIKQVQGRIRQNQAKAKELAATYASLEGKVSMAREDVESAMFPVTRAAQALKDAGEPEGGASDPELVRLHTAANKARSRYDAAVEPVLASLRETQPYQQALGRLASAEEFLRESSIRTGSNSTSPRMAAASQSVMDAKASIVAMEDEALRDDETVAAALEALEEARAAVVAYRADQFESGSIQHKDERINQLRKEYYKAQQEYQQASRLRFEAEAELRKVKQEVLDLERAIAADTAWVARVSSRNAK